MKKSEMIKTKQQGFTLIELMIVVAIIGILAAIALPAYNTYVTKARFTEVVNATSGVKTAIEICVQSKGGVANCDDGTAATSDVSVQSAKAGASGGALVASVGVTPTSATNTITITATAVGSGTTAVSGLKGETYDLLGTYSSTTGQVTWAVDTATGKSTCLGAGICNQ